MIPCKPNGQRLLFSLLTFIIFSAINNVSAQDAAAGKALFMSKCASCHNPLKESTGPALMNLEERGKWADHKEILKWATNPAAYMAKDPYTQGLITKYGSMMSAQELTQAYKRRSYAILAARTDARILDVGCGTGDDVLALAQFVGSAVHAGSSA